jgi:HK97 family phage prohead protease
VPWNVVGRVADGSQVKFLPGSLDATRRPPTVRDHDRARPIGRVVDAADTGTALTARARISHTRDGDEALVLAADGVLAAFSVGVDPTVFHYDADGVLVVTAGDWQELSVLTTGAYPGARITDVAASPPEPNGVSMTMTDTPIDPETPDPENPETPETPETPEDLEVPTVEAGPPAVPVLAGRGAARHDPPMTIRRLAALIAGAQSGQIEAGAANRMIQTALRQGSIAAQLVDVTMVGANNVAAPARPTYMMELVELISWGTPLIDALRQGDLERGDYPQKTFSRWTTAPTVGLQAAEKDPITSTAVKIDPASAPVQTWAGGNDISLQTVEFGSPSFVEDYIRAAGIDYARKSDTYACTTLLAAAADVAPPAAGGFIANVAALVGALSPATTPPGGLFLAMSYDQGVGLIGVPRDEGPAFWDGNVNFGAFTPTVTAGGLTAFVDPNLPVRTYLLGHRQGATWYDKPGTPFNLRVNDVHLLGLDVAVYGFGALGIQYPGSFTKMTVAAPV